MLSMPMCAEISWAMQALSGVEYSTSEQHIDMFKSRQSLDIEDHSRMMKVSITYVMESKQVSQ